MVDKVANYATKSLARYIKTSVAAINSAYVVTPDFDWDKQPVKTTPSAPTIRPLPFAGIILINDGDMPFSVGNILYERTIRTSVEVCAASYGELVDITSSIRQSLRSAINPATSGVGIVLYNFDAPVSGGYYANGGTLQVELGQSQYFGQEDEEQLGNRKYRSVTLIEMSCFKDVTATLLENKGRINLTDT